MRRSLSAGVAALLLAGCSSGSEPGVAGTSVGSSSAYLAVDAAALYWVDPVMGAVMRQARASDEPTRLATTPSTWNVIAVNDTAVFYYGSDTGTIMSVPKQGGAAEGVAQAIAPYMIAVDDDHLYLSRMEANPVTSEVVDHSLDNGKETVLEADIALSLSISGSDLVGTSCSRDGVWTLRRTGGSRTPLVSDALCPITIAADGANVCYGDFDMGLYCVPREGGTARHLTPLYFGPIHSFVLDGPFVYTLEDPQLMRYAVDTGDSIMVAQAPGAVGIAISDGVAYWTAPDTAGVLGLHSAPL